MTNIKKNPRNKNLPQVKQESWDMAMSLVQERRLSVEMAVWALGYTGHTKDEVNLFKDSVSSYTQL